MSVAFISSVRVDFGMLELVGSHSAEFYSSVGYASLK